MPSDPFQGPEGAFERGGLGWFALVQTGALNRACSEGSHEH